MSDISFILENKPTEPPTWWKNVLMANIREVAYNPIADFLLHAYGYLHQINGNESYDVISNEQYYDGKYLIERLTQNNYQQWKSLDRNNFEYVAAVLFILSRLQKLSGSPALCDLTETSLDNMRVHIESYYTIKATTNLDIMPEHVLGLSSNSVLTESAYGIVLLNRITMKARYLVGKSLRNNASLIVLSY